MLLRLADGDHIARAQFPSYLVRLGFADQLKLACLWIKEIAHVHATLRGHEVKVLATDVLASNQLLALLPAELGDLYALLTCYDGNVGACLVHNAIISVEPDLVLAVFSILFSKL